MTIKSNEKMKSLSILKDFICFLDAAKEFQKGLIY